MKTFFVIQGHTIYYKELIEKYKDTPNVIWCTEEDSPELHLKKIDESNITLITIPRMKNSGYGMVNIQVNSTIKGLEKAKSLGADYCIKIRSDMYLSNNKLFIENMNLEKDVCMLAYTQNRVNGMSKHYNIEYINSWMEENYYNKVISNVNNYSYVLDFMNYGKIDDMLLFWGLPTENYIKLPAELKFQYRYLKEKGYKNFNFSFEETKKVFGYFLSDLKKLNIECCSLKRNNNYTNFYFEEKGNYGFRG